MTFAPAITGIGLITPLGRNVAETWRALMEGEFVRDHARLTPPRDDDHHREDHRPRVTRLASAAAREAVRHAKWTAAELSDPRTALVLGTSKGPVERWLTPPPEHIPDMPYVEAGGSQLFGLHEPAAALAAELRLGHGPRLTVSAACAGGLHAMIRGCMMVRGGEADRVLIVAAEASVHPLFLGSFRRLGVLPAEGVGCRPFDVDRAGFLMSEAAAAVCLESPEMSRGRGGNRVIARVERFALGGDATHLTGGDPDGVLLRRLLRQVIDRRPVDLVHAHGTGTPFNDPIELAAIDDALPPDGSETPTRLYSHKGALGHSLGAAGLVSVVLNCACHQTGTVPPNVQTRRPLPTRRVVLSGSPQPTTIRRSLVVAAGFGGATAVVSVIGPW